MVTAREFVEKVKIPLFDGWGYIYATWGTLWTKAKQDAATREMTVKYGSKWIGDMVTDCSGLLRWALYQLGENIVHHARYQYTDWCNLKGTLKDGLREDGTRPLPGTAVFLKGTQAHIHHVGVYIGGDTVVEAKGTVYGVVTSRLNHWDHWGQLKMVDYTDAGSLEYPAKPTVDEAAEDAEAGTVIKAVVDNPQTWLNVRANASESAPVRFQVKKGSIVDVLDAGEPDWWQIRYGGQIGWAYAKYLKPLDSMEDEPEAGSNKVTDIWDELQSVRSKLSELSEEIGKIMEKINEGSV